MRSVRVVKALLVSALAAVHFFASPASAQEAVLRVGAAYSDITGLDPFKAPSGATIPVMGWIYGGLVRFTPGIADLERMEGDLAESWEASPDKLTWTFTLRKGVQFHRNFGEATAEDVVYSLNKAADPARSAHAATYSAIESVRALDRYKVQVKLKHGVPNFLALVTNYHAGMIVSAKADRELGSAFNLNPVGFGPFEVVELKKQNALFLKAFDKYFRGRPKIDRIEYRFVPSDANRELAFRSGEIDIFMGKREEVWVDRMRKQGNAVVDVFPHGDFRALHLNRNIKPLDDRRVREAIALSIDREQLLKLQGGAVTVLGETVVPRAYYGAANGAWNLKQDIPKAKELLAQAGYPNGLKLKSVITSLPVLQAVMEAIQNQLKRSGIDVDVSVVDHAAYLAAIKADQSALVLYGAGRIPIADSYLSEFFHSRAAIGAPGQMNNYSHCSVADKEIDAARSEPDKKRQLEYWKLAQEKIVADICAVPLFELLQVWVRHPRIDLGYKLQSSLFISPPITHETRILKR